MKWIQYRFRKGFQPQSSRKEKGIPVLTRDIKTPKCLILRILRSAFSFCVQIREIQENKKFQLLLIPHSMRNENTVKRVLELLIIIQKYKITFNPLLCNVVKWSDTL